MGAVVLVGRELYRLGYMSPDGPNSKIREAGAIPLNVAELLVLGSVMFVFARYAFGPYVWRRKFVKKYFTHSPVQIEKENQYKDLLLGRNQNLKKVRIPGDMSETALRAQ